MTVSHLMGTLPYIAGLIVALCLLCVCCEPFPEDEPDAVDFGREWK